MKKGIFIFVFLFSQWVFASPACFDVELNAETKKPFGQEAWTQNHEFWLEQEPNHPGYINLMRAYSIYRGETVAVKKLKRDKRKHCYLGCRISQDISFEAADYVAWYKESRDLNDCNKKSIFEVADYDATLDGAELGLELEEPSQCFDVCNEY